MIFPNPHRIKGTCGYHGCKWCRGSGCLQCQIEEDKAYKADFPNGPEPLATIAHDGTPEGVASILMKLLGGIDEEAKKRAEEIEPDAHHALSQFGVTDEQIRSHILHSAAVDILGERAVAMQAMQANQK